MTLTKTDLREVDKLINRRLDALNKLIKRILGSQNEQIDGVDKRIDGLGEKMEQRFAEQKNDLLNIKDEIMKELKDMREEQADHNFSHTRIDDTLREHDQRITVLEKPTS